MKRFVILEALDALVGQRESALLPQRDDGLAPFPAHHFSIAFSPSSVNIINHEQASFRKSSPNRADSYGAKFWPDILRGGKTPRSPYYQTYQRGSQTDRYELPKTASVCFFCGPHALGSKPYWKFTTVQTGAWSKLKAKDMHSRAIVRGYMPQKLLEHIVNLCEEEYGTE